MCPLGNEETDQSHCLVMRGSLSMTLAPLMWKIIFINHIQFGKKKLKTKADGLIVVSFK